MLYWFLISSRIELILFRAKINSKTLYSSETLSALNPYRPRFCTQCEGLYRSAFGSIQHFKNTLGSRGASTGMRFCIHTHIYIYSELWYFKHQSFALGHRPIYRTLLCQVFIAYCYTRVFDIDVIFLWEFATNNKRLSLLTNSILQTSFVKTWAKSIY